MPTIPKEKVCPVPESPAGGFVSGISRRTPRLGRERSRASPGDACAVLFQTHALSDARVGARIDLRKKRIDHVRRSTWRRYFRAIEAGAACRAGEAPKGDAIVRLSLSEIESGWLEGQNRATVR